MTKSLKDSILEDLHASGTPLEMSVAARFLRAAHVQPASPEPLYRGQGFDSVQQSEHYWDAELKSHRETDVVGVVWAADRSASVTVVAECKHQSGGALVIFYGSDGSGHIDTEPVATDAADEWIRRHRREGIGDRRLIAGVPRHPGYGLKFMPSSQSKDHAYGAIQQVAAAARGLLPSESDGWHVALPLIVTDVPLFRCDLDLNGDPQLTEADRGLIRWPLPSRPGRTMTIHVVGERVLDDFLEDMVAAAHEILEKYRTTAGRS